MSDCETINPKVVALVGPPNAGKTTLFNWLTNSKYKTVNYPGATVEYSLADLASRYGGGFTVMDTPGTYSLSPKSEDEVVTRKALFQHPTFGLLQNVIAVVDATQLTRHLVLVQQLIEAGFSVIVALTMTDLLRKAGKSIHVREIEQALGCPVVPVDGLLGGGVKELVDAVRNLKLRTDLVNLSRADLTRDHQLQLLKKSETIALQCVKDQGSGRVSPILERTRQWDQWLLHPILGLVFFVVIMTLLFTAIFTVATPFMDRIDSFFSWAALLIQDVGEGGLWSDFLGNGVMTSFGAVLVFVPQIFILFLMLGYLEATGYLARAATLVDRPLSFLGMSGRSFVPLLSGFACAVPALMATRNISSKRDRWITMMIIPLMTCSARLPVYALLLSFLFKGKSPWLAGVTLSGLYIGGLLVGALVARILHRILKLESSSFFLMELPLYRRPRWSVVLSQAWSKTYGYVRRAGPPIFIFAMLIWVGTTFPRTVSIHEQASLESSYAGQLGKVIEPVFEPMGADWRVGVSLISAFAAREVFVSSLAVIFNVVTEDEDSLQEGLLASMREAKNSTGAPLFSIASVVALLIFVMVALQCTSTTAMMIRETGSSRGAILQVIAYNVLAYAMAVGVYQLWS